VLPAGSDPGAIVQPAELVFSTTPGLPGSQTLRVYNIGAASKTFYTSAALYSPELLLVAVPREGALDPSQPARVIVQPLGIFAVGTYTGALTFQFSDG